MVSIRRQLLTDHVYQYLVGVLTSRRLELGAHVNALTIAEELSISRTTVNKAIARLVEEGWVRAGDNRRPVVVDYPPEPHEASSSPASFTFANQTEQTYEVLLEQLLRGVYRPGETLKERRLAKELGVNPVTIHRACEWLSSDGLLVRLRRRGWQVVVIQAEDVRQIYRIRLLLEPLTIPEATRQIRPETLDELERESDRLIALGESGTTYERRKADYRLHRALCDASGNRILTETLDPLIRKAILMTTVGFRYNRVIRGFKEHKEILEALRQRDAAGATKRLKAHLLAAMKFNLATWEKAR